MWQKRCFMSAAEESPGAGAAVAEKPAPDAVVEDPYFADEVYSQPGGEGVRWCIQCGVCSASCPNVNQMDYSPRRTIAMIRAGRRKDVLTSNSPWICASCYLCTVRCPRGVKPTELMHVLERLSTRYGMHSKQVLTPAMYRAFVNSVKSHGRVHEVGLMMEYYRKTNPASALKISSVGLGLLKHGRMPLKASKIKGIGQLNAMLKKAEILGGAR